ncbi:hypothetical protein ACFL5Z_20680 [Planctomycetota bacterium]
MKKVWVYKRKNTKGWWVGWYESGKRKAKALPTKALAEHYRQIKYTQLNSDVFKEAAKVLLGHAKTSTTEIYLLEEVQEAVKVAKLLASN